MSWLNQWMKEIIMIVLLATFIDLVLPNRSMQRYVKLMLSLIILLALLSPVLKLFDAKLADQLASGWSSALSSTIAVENERTSSVAEIRRQGEWLAREHGASALRLTEAEIGNQMKEQLTLAFRHHRQPGEENPERVAEKEVNIERLQVTLTHNAKGDPTIAQIELTLSTGQVAEQAGEYPVIANNQNEVKAVEPIKHVQIESGVRDEEQGTSHQSGTHTSLRSSGQRVEEVEKYRAKIANQAVRSLMSTWIVNSEQIKVEWGQGDTKL